MSLKLGKAGAALVAVMLVATASGARAATDYPTLVRTLSSAVAAKYYDPYLHGADWPGVTRRAEAQARDVHSDAGFERLAREMFSALKSSHLEVHAPKSDIDAEGWRPAFKTREMEAHHLVVDVSDLSDARAQGVHLGDAVTNWSALPGTIGTRASVALSGCDGVQRTATVRREGVYWPPPAPSFHWRRLRIGPQTTLGYLRVDAFDDDGAELADKAMADLGDTQGLIIDLRGNHGGNASAVRLASYFVSRAGPAVILLDRNHLQALGRTPTPADAKAAPAVRGAYTTAAVWAALKANHGAVDIWTEDVGSKRYTNPVAVLIGPETASAAEGFAWVMRLRSPAVFVGETSAGALLSAEESDIGQGWSVTIPEAGIWAPDGVDYGDKAIAPQIAVPLTRADLCMGRDRQLETAMERVSQPAR